MTDDRIALAEGWAAEHGPALAGRPASDAVAAAEEAGLRTKTIRSGGVATQEFGIGRVRITVDADGLVIGVAAG